MPTFSYKGYDFDVDHTPTEGEFSQMSAYVDTLPPKQTKQLEQEEPSFLDKVTPYAKEFAKGTAGTLVGAADLAMGIPKAVTAAVAAPIRTAIYGDPETQRKVAQEASEGIFGTPSEGLRKLGLPEEYISGTVPQKVIEYPFQKLTEGIEAGGDFVAEQTGSRNAGGIAKQLADVAFIAAPIPGLKAAKKGATSLMERFTGGRPTETLRTELGYGTEAPKNFREQAAEQMKAETETSAAYAKEVSDIDAQMMKYPQDLQAPQFGMGGKVARPVDSIGREKAKLEPGERTTQTEMDLEIQKIAVEQKQREIDQAWEQHQEAKSILSKEEVFAEQERLQQEQQSLDTLRQQLAEEPLTLEPSQGTKTIVSPQERTTYRPRNQQGAVNFGEIVDGLEKLFKDIAPKTVDEFIVAAKQAGLETNDQAYKTLYEGFTAEKQANKTITDFNNKSSFFNNFQQMGDRVAFESVKPEEVIQALQHGEDSPRTNAYESHLMPQGYMPAMASKNKPYKMAVQYLKSMFDANAMRAENALFKPSIKNQPGGFIHELTRLEKFGDLSSATSLVKQWFQAKGDPNYKFSLSPTQEKVNQIKQKLFDNMRNEINKWLPENKQIAEIPNYIPSIRTGKFWGEARLVQPDGKLSKPLIFSAMTDSGANSIAQQLAKKGYQVSETKTRGEIRNDFGDAEGNRAANYQYYLDTIGENSPELTKLYTDISRTMQAEATTTAGSHNRQKQWSGFEGEIGNKPWLSDKQNYYEAKKAMIETVEAHYAWLSAQEAAAFGKQLVDPKNKIPENNRSNLQKYIESNIIGNRYNDGISSMINNAFTSWGVDPKLVGHITGNVSNTITAMMTAFGNQALALTNVVQPLTVLLPQMVQHAGLSGLQYMPQALGKGAWEFASMFSAKQASEIAKTLGVSEIEIKSWSKNFNEKLDYAERAGIIAPTLIDPTPLFNNKFVNRAHQFAVQGMLTRPSEQAARWTTFSTLVDFYRNTGMKREEAYTKARENTETLMVDYGLDARANIWKSLGELGKVFGRIQTFATNQWGQLYTYAKHAKESPKEFAAFATYLGTLYALGGISGMPGFDAVEELVNSAASKEGETFSLRNHIRKGVGENVYNPFDSLTGLGMSPSFASRSIDTSGNGLGLAAAATPVPKKLGEMASVAGRRLYARSPAWEAETEAEKGRELQTFLPSSARGIIEDKYMKPTVGGKEKNVSPNTGLPTHTVKPNEKFFGNIRSKERVKDTELTSESFKEQNRFKEDKIEHEKELTSLAVDMYAYGNKSSMKEKRFVTNINKYIKNFNASDKEIENIVNKIPNASFDNQDVAALVALGKKQTLTMDDVRRLLFHKQYMELRK